MIKNKIVPEENQKQVDLMSEVSIVKVRNCDVKKAVKK